MTPKQKLFADHYLANGMNGTRSYIAIYKCKNENTARTNAAQLLAHPNISPYIAEKRKNLSEKLQLDAEWVLRRFKDISDRCMTAVPVMKFDPVEKCMKQQTELTEDGEEVGVFMFDSQGANKATESIGKHLGFFEQDNKQKQPPANIGNLSPDDLLTLASIQKKSAT